MNKKNKTIVIKNPSKEAIAAIKKGLKNKKKRHEEIIAKTKSPTN